MFVVHRYMPQICLTTVYRNFARQVKKDRRPVKRSVNNTMITPATSFGAKLFNLEENEVDSFDEFESDFIHVHKSHKEYVEETKRLKEQEKLYIVREKYFKEKLPNFLTWHDKQQIRYLHNKDPEEWTIERLSEGFPALPQTIKKIIKSIWNKETQNKITNHDASVQKNWKLFKKGQMPKVPPELEQHLKKFTNRALNLKPFVVPSSQANVVNIKKQNLRTDFSDIITSYQNIKNKSESEKSETKEPKMLVHQTEDNAVRSQRHITLGKLQTDVSMRVEKGKSVDEEDWKILERHKTEDEKQLPEQRQSITKLVEQKYQSSNSVQCYKKVEKDISHLNYPEKITIPKNLNKKGSIYKLNDCYYDIDGEFLYRVPGMY